MTLSGIGEISEKCPICQFNLRHDDDLWDVGILIRVFICKNNHIFTEKWTPKEWRQEND